MGQGVTERTIADVLEWIEDEITYNEESAINPWNMIN